MGRVHLVTCVITSTRGSRSGLPRSIWLADPSGKGLLSLDAGGYRPFVADRQRMSAIRRGCPGRRSMTCRCGGAARVERAAAAVGGGSARDVEGGDVVYPPDGR